ncbi:MAG TPA: VWA domain-containing protein [Pyrinomonadaceae bacterium]|nr:VWA domain-containing protein [Pyrinomonadaceae bacterium]
MSSIRRALSRPAFFFCLISLSVGLNPFAVAWQSPGEAAQTAMRRPDADIVLLTITVTDSRGTPVGGLDKSAFTVSENKVPQEISFFNAEDEPVSVGIVFDLSGSLAGSTKLKAARNAVLRFIELSHSANDYFVIAFAARPLVLIDWTRNSRAFAAQLSRFYFTSKSESKASLNTALYDSCYLAVEKMNDGAHSRKAILLITDGQDNESRYTFKEVRERLKETGVMLYSMGIVGGDDPGSSLAMDGQAILDELSAVSGGKAFFPNNKKEIDVLFEWIALELRHQYLIGFRPAKGGADGKWHKIKVKVTPPPMAEGKRPSLYVRTREGYYAPRSLP